MTLDRSTVLEGIDAELRSFSSLVRALTPSHLGLPTRCEGWDVRAVAGHVIGTVADVCRGEVAGQGTVAVTARQASERADRTSDELADELDAALPTLVGLLAGLDDAAWAGPSLLDPALTMGFAVEAIWYDAYVHGDDIRAAVGLPSERGDGLTCAVHHVLGYLEQAGQGRPPVDDVDPLDLVLAATGRLAPATVGLDPSVQVYAAG